MIPFFYSHSDLSKYLTKCIDYILKTEITLPPSLSLLVRAGSFVNVHGGKGKNKAADLHKENEVKLVKDLIRGLGSNKTEKSIIAVSKASPVISSISDNFDNMLHLKKMHTTHKRRSKEEDINAILVMLQGNSPWQVKDHRHLSHYRGIPNTPFSFDRSKLEVTITDIVQRLLRDLPIEVEEDDVTDDSDSAEDSSEDED